MFLVLILAQTNLLVFSVFIFFLCVYFLCVFLCLFLVFIFFIVSVFLMLCNTNIIFQSLVLHGSCVFFNTSMQFLDRSISFGFRRTNNKIRKLYKFLIKTSVYVAARPCIYNCSFEVFLFDVFFVQFSAWQGVVFHITSYFGNMSSEVLPTPRSSILG